MFRHLSPKIPSQPGWYWYREFAWGAPGRYAEAEIVRVIRFESPDPNHPMTGRMMFFKKDLWSPKHWIVEDSSLWGLEPIPASFGYNNG